MELTKLNLYALRRWKIAAWSLSAPSTFLFNFEAPFEILQSVVRTTRITHVEKSNESKFSCSRREFSWKAGVAAIGVSTCMHSIGFLVVYFRHVKITSDYLWYYPPAGAFFSKVRKLFGPISGATIPFLSSQPRGSSPSNFAIHLVFLALKTC